MFLVPHDLIRVMNIVEWRWKYILVLAEIKSEAFCNYQLLPSGELHDVTQQLKSEFFFFKSHKTLWLNNFLQTQDWPKM